MRTAMRYLHSTLRTPHSAFTLIEMLVVMSIISVLAGMLLPGLAAAREKGRRISCINNLKQIGYALTLYTDDYDQYIPTNGPINVPGDGYTGKSTNRLRVLPAMEQGLGKLMLGYYLGNDVKAGGGGQLADIFGCPSHSPFMPGAVKSEWRDSSSVDCAYLWRETDASPSPNALNRLGVRVRHNYAIVMDNSTLAGLPAGNAHKWEWTNILYSDIHAVGSSNTDAFQVTVTGTAPNQVTTVDCRFTHDGSAPATAQVWANADAEAEK